MKKLSLSTLLLVLPIALIAWWFWPSGSVHLPKNRDSQKFNNLAVVSHLDVPVEKGQSIVYSGTLQLAWNELMRIVGRSDPSEW